MSNREIQVKRLISLFEPITDSRPEEKQRRASLQNDQQELGEIRLRPILEDAGRPPIEVIVQRVERDHAAQSVPPSEPLTSHHKSKATSDKEEIHVATPPTAGVSSGDMSKPNHLEKPTRLKDVKELLKMSTNENDRLRSELNTLTKKLESVENAFETLRKEHRSKTEESVKSEASNELAKLDQNLHTDTDALRSTREELSKEKQTRTVIEKRLKLANSKILDLLKKLKEKDKELLTYKTDRELLRKSEENLLEERRIRSEVPGQSSEANERNPKPNQQLLLDLFTIKTSEFDATRVVDIDRKPKSSPKPDIDLGLHYRDSQLLSAKQVQGRKKSSHRPSIKPGPQFKSLDFDIDSELDADLDKSGSSSGKKALDSSTADYSLPFPDFTDITSHPIPNLYSGFNRPRRQKRHSVRSSAGSLAKSECELVVVYI